MAGKFEQIRDDYYHAWFRYHPEAALDAGVTGFEHLLRPYSDEEQGALLSLNEKLMDALEELDERDLGPDDEVDLELMRGAAFLEMEQTLQHDWRKRDPEEFLPLEAIYQLTIRHTDNFAGALRQRLAAIPDYLLNARHYIGQDRERIPARWLESAITAVESGSNYLQALNEDPRVREHADQLPDLDVLIADAVDGFRRYGRFLDKEIGARAAGDFAVGHKRFSHLLEYRHFLNVTPEELYEFGNRLFEGTMIELKAVCRRITGGEDLAELERRVHGRSDGAGSPVSVYRQQMEAARYFIESRDLVSIPDMETICVEETPVFLRHRIPFAAYMAPGLEDVPQQGRYYVTPAADAETLALHSPLAMAHTSVHEAYPGHHLQFTTAHRHPAARSPARMLNKSATLYEGWALYCEQLMFETGFLDQPESEFILLRDRLWRALRIVLDVGMQTRGQGIEDAVSTMCARLGFSATQALGEATWYSRAPTIPMGYATGWAMINAARDDLVLETTPQALKSFHDALLGQGSCALTLVLKRAFGNDLPTRALSRILQPDPGVH